jgi:HAD superfamily hydrolase (TIGR01549 family)
MIKAVTFDCWDTLIVDDERLNVKMLNYLEFVCQENGISLADKIIADVFAEENKLREEYVVAQNKTKNAMQRTETLLELLDVQLTLSEIVRISYYFDTVALEIRPPKVPQVEEILKALSRTYRLGVICNGGFHSGDTVRQILDAHKLLEHFAWLSFSDEMDVAKPHPLIFEDTIKQFGCEMEEAVHIGDSEYSDILGAKNAGMKAILFTGINQKYRNNTTADFVIDDYDDLRRVLSTFK